MICPICNKEIFIDNDYYYNYQCDNILFRLINNTIKSYIYYEDDLVLDGDIMTVFDNRPYTSIYKRNDSFVYLIKIDRFIESETINDIPRIYKRLLKLKGLS